MYAYVSLCKGFGIGDHECKSQGHQNPPELELNKGSCELAITVDDK